MSGKSKPLVKQPYLSETLKIRCRVCKSLILRKNYKSHLTSEHPEENSSDLTPHGQTRISFFTDTKKASKDVTVGEKRTKDLPGQNQLDRKVPNKVSKPSDAAEQCEEVPCPPPHNIERSTSAVSVHSITEPADQDKLDKIIAKIDNLQQHVEQIQKCNVAAVSVPKNVKDSDEMTNKEIQNVILVARSLKELETLGFEYNAEKGQLLCTVCDPKSIEGLSNEVGAFAYNQDLGAEFDEEEYLPRAFVNLKKNVKRHCTDGKQHKEKLKLEEERKKEEKKLKTLNQEAGMNLGRVCMKLFTKGRPYVDFEEDVLLMKKAGAKIGELNHSRLFPAAFRPFVSKAVDKRVKRFLSERLQQTGHLPPVNITADKATYKHRTRQFLSVKIFFPFPRFPERKIFFAALMLGLGLGLG